MKTAEDNQARGVELVENNKLCLQVKSSKLFQRETSDYVTGPKAYSLV